MGGASEAPQPPKENRQPAWVCQRLPDGRVVPSKYFPPQESARRAISEKMMKGFALLVAFLACGFRVQADP